MTAASRRRRTLAEYLTVEEESAARRELLDRRIFAMAGGTPERAALAAALLVLLGAARKGSPRRPHSADLRVFVPATGLYTYPDAALICGAPEHAPSSPTHVTNPRLVVVSRGVRPRRPRGERAPRVGRPVLAHLTRPARAGAPSRG